MCIFSLYGLFLLLLCSVCELVYGQGQCTQPDPISHAIPKSFDTNFAVGFNMAYDCFMGYQYSGSSNFRTCQADLTWSAAEFQCLPQSCDIPDSPQNGGFNGNEYVFGKSITYFCNKGYQFVMLPSQGTTSRCVIDTSSNPASVKWTQLAPTCRMVSCPPPAMVPNGSFNDQGLSHTYSTRIEYTCQAGYVASESSPIYRTCNENGTWGDPPVCSVDYGCDFEDHTDQTCSYTNAGWKRTLTSRDYEGNRGFELYGSPKPASTASFTSRSVDIASGGACLRFYYRITSLPEGNGRFLVDIMKNGASQVIWEKTAVQDTWELANVDIVASSNPKVWSFKAIGPSEVYLDAITYSSTPCQDSTTASPDESATIANPSLKTWHYVLIAIGGVLVLAAISGGVYWVLRKKENRGIKVPTDDSPPL